MSGFESVSVHDAKLDILSQQNTEVLYDKGMHPMSKTTNPFSKWYSLSWVLHERRPLYNLTDTSVTLLTCGHKNEYLYKFQLSRLHKLCKPDIFRA